MREKCLNEPKGHDWMPLADQSARILQILSSVPLGEVRQEAPSIAGIRRSESCASRIRMRRLHPGVELNGGE